MILTRKEKGKRSYLYCICAPNGKQYIGKSNNPKDRWRGHIKGPVNNGVSAIRAAISKYGVEHMTFQIIASFGSEEEAYTAEAILIAELNTLAPAGYNLTSGGKGGFTASEELRQKLRRSWTKDRRKQESLRVSGSNNPMYGKKADDALRARLSAANKGKTRSAEHRHNLSLALLGKPKSLAARLHLSEAKRGKPVPAVVLRRAIEANTGRLLSEAHRRKISEAQRGKKNHAYGKRLSDARRQQISEAGRGRKHTPETLQKMSLSRTLYWRRKRERRHDTH